MANIPAYVGYFYNEAPSNCWGSSELMGAWMNHKQMERDALEAEK